MRVASAKKNALWVNTVMAVKSPALPDAMMAFAVTQMELASMDAIQVSEVHIVQMPVTNTLMDKGVT